MAFDSLPWFLISYRLMAFVQLKLSLSKLNNICEPMEINLEALANRIYSDSLHPFHVYLSHSKSLRLMRKHHTLITDRTANMLFLTFPACWSLITM